METRMSIAEKFELADGVTILACKGCDPKIDVVNKRYRLISGGEVRQVLTIVGERRMLNQNSNLDQKAFETRDIVKLSQEEARSGDWQLVAE